MTINTIFLSILLIISIGVNIYTCLPKKTKKENNSEEKLCNYTCIENENQLLYYLSLKEHINDYFLDMIEVMESDGIIKMTFPFLDSKNEFIEIYFNKTENNGELKISDNNETLNKLIPLHKNSNNIDSIDDFIKTKDIIRNENELYFYINSNSIKLPEKVFEFIQTLISIQNLRY